MVALVNKGRLVLFQYFSVLMHWAYPNKSPPWAAGQSEFHFAKLLLLTASLRRWWPILGRSGIGQLTAGRPASCWKPFSTKHSACRDVLIRTYLRRALFADEERIY